MKSFDPKENEKVVLSTISNKKFIIYIYSDKEFSVLLKNLDAKLIYKAKWFDPRTGTYTAINESPLNGSIAWKIPSKPSAEDYLLILTSENK